MPEHCSMDNYKVPMINQKKLVINVGVVEFEKLTILD
jgi:hypothetical protein